MNLYVDVIVVILFYFIFNRFWSLASGYEEQQ